MEHFKYIKVKKEAEIIGEYYKYQTTELRIKKVDVLISLGLYESLKEDLYKECESLELKLKIYKRISRAKMNELLDIYEATSLLENIETFSNLPFKDLVDFVSDLNMPFYIVANQQVFLKKELESWISENLKNNPIY